MGAHPINLAIRFLLELLALLAFAIWGWGQSATWVRYVWAFILPIAAAAVWGTFNVPNDPSRSGKAPVVVTGIMRLTLELIFFSLAICCLYQLGYTLLSFSFATITLLHYFLSYDRISWLVRR